uniref:Uncharacterized protein n=1 Tax=Strombidium rassoulzadegani TaxID=1082188 RepID=A0A7S3CSL6_9SPIT
MTPAEYFVSIFGVGRPQLLHGIFLGLYGHIIWHDILLYHYLLARGVSAAGLRGDGRPIYDSSCHLSVPAAETELHLIEVEAVRVEGLVKGLSLVHLIVCLVGGVEILELVILVETLYDDVEAVPEGPVVALAEGVELIVVGLALREYL